MANTTVSLEFDNGDPKATLDYHIDSDTDIAVSEDIEGNKSIELTKKF
jgi:hypothetical protein